MSARSRDDLWGDLLDLCDEVLESTRATTKARFVRDPDAVRALERRLELIGEIATRLGDDVPDADVSWSDLRALRVVLAHAYHRVVPQRLWIYATGDVPRIRAALE